MFYYYQMNINRNTSRCIGKSYLLTNCKIIKSLQKQISEGFFVFCSKKSTSFKVAKMQFLPLVGNAFLRYKADATTLPKCTLTPPFFTFRQTGCVVFAWDIHLSEVSDTKFEKLSTLYEQRQKEFHNSVLLFNSWYSCLIEKRENENREIGVILDDKLSNNFIDISLEEVKSSYDFLKIKETFPNAIEIDYAEIVKKMEFFQDKEMHKVFRGKYELEFLIKMIREILKDSRTEKKIVSSKIDFSFGDGSNLGQQQALNIFEAYAETPKTLLDYLEFIVKKE